MAARLSSWKWVGLIAGVLFVLDFFSKQWIIHHFTAGTGFVPPIAVFHNLLGIDFYITHAVNKGAAWGFFDSYPQTLLLFRIVLITALIGYFYCNPLKPKWRLPFTLIIVGAIANVVDYFLYGHVIDMFLFIFWGYEYPIFNVADSSIFLGTMSILYMTMRHHDAT
jgi:signal peptidase II